MKNFFEHQEQAHHNTRMLMVLMALGVIAMGCAIYGLLVVIDHFAFITSADALYPKPWFRPQLLLATIAGTAVMVWIASASRLLFLRGGGSKVAEMMGGRLVSGSPRDVLEKRFVNVVEEMSIASGMPVPQAYVLDDETGINAFAAGQTTHDAVVAVTRGCLEKLTREELQGVVAHEMSHITHGDMRINMRLMGVVFGIVCIALLGRLILRVATHARGGRRDKDGGVRAAILALGVGLWVIGSLGELFGKLIKAAIGREREYLADASAVQFTRNPRGIGGALKKIGGFVDGSRVQSARAEEASHMFFSDIHRFSSLFATHPPLDERVARIDPTFNGKWPTVADVIAQPDDVEGVSMLSAQVASRDPSRVVDSIGGMSAQSVVAAQSLLDGVPVGLREGARNAFTACAIAYAMLWSDAPEVIAKQRELVRTSVGDALLNATERVLPMLRTLSRPTCLALTELLAPALRTMSADQRAGFLHVVRALMDADDRVTLFEHLIGDALTIGLQAPTHRKQPRRVALSMVHAEVGLLLSLLSHAGGTTEADVATCFQHAAARLPELRLQLSTVGDGQMRGLSHCLETLRALAPADSARLIDAMAHGVFADQRVTDDEAVLVAATCLALEVPMPVWGT